MKERKAQHTGKNLWKAIRATCIAQGADMSKWPETATGLIIVGFEGKEKLFCYAAGTIAFFPAAKYLFQLSQMNKEIPIAKPTGKTN